MNKLKTTALLLLFFSVACGTKKVREKKPFVVDSTATTIDTHKQIQQINSNTTFGVVKENTQFAECRYPDIVAKILSEKKQRDIKKLKLPAVALGDWFHCLYDAAHSDPAITKFLDDAIENTITYMAKSVEFDYAALEAQDSTAKIYIRK
jgi:hypothetical protein